MPIETFDEFRELDRTIDEAFIRLSQFDQEDEDYAQIVDQIAKLTKVRESIANMTLKMFEATTKAEEVKLTHSLRQREHELKVHESERPDRVSRDALLGAGASVVGILLILGHERLNVITSKALGFVSRIR